MAKVRSQFVCQQCGYSQVGWAGRCPNCGEWNTLVETVVSTNSKYESRSSKKDIKKPISLSSVSSKKTKRVSTKITELDRVLGGGIVPGQVILIAGEPGIGKSTILLQLAEKLASLPAQAGASRLGNIIYSSGEESVGQIKLRADRLSVKKKTIQIMEETDVDLIISTVRDQKTQDQKLKAIVIDSIQTMSTSDLSGMAGSVGQVRECTYRLIRFAKSSHTPVFIVGHVTKQGNVAGPAVLAHLVDTVLWFEGIKTSPLRLLRAHKNRFGPTDEVGVFIMKDKGLVSATNPSSLFLTKSETSVPGSVKASIIRGTRPIIIEVQALVIPTKMAFSKRIAQGIDSRRLELLLAVLTKRCGLPLGDFDCFVNVTGGISLKNDPSIDLAVCLSVASAYFDKPILKSAVVVGEVGLLGDIREVPSEDKRISEAKRIGFGNVINHQKAKFLQEAIKKYLK